MSGTYQVGQTSHTGTSAAVCSLYSPGPARPIGRHHASFSCLSGKISERHSSEGNGLYLFVGVYLVFGGLATVRRRQYVQCVGCWGCSQRCP